MKEEQNDLVSIKRLTDQIGQFRQALLSIPDDFSHDILASFKPVKQVVNQNIRKNLYRISPSLQPKVKPLF
jgi:hypothetical protein